MRIKIVIRDSGGRVMNLGSETIRELLPNYTVTRAGDNYTYNVRGASSLAAVKDVFIEKLRNYNKDYEAEIEEM